MVMQVFMDESVDDDGTLVIAGHVATVQNWADFSGEWEKLLPQATLAGSGSRRHHFKMSEMAAQGKMWVVPAFWRIVEDHVVLSLSATLNAGQLQRARQRIYVPNLRIDWGYMLNPYFVGWRLLMDNFHSLRPRLASVIPLDERVDFYFDERSEKKKIRDAWDAYMAERDPDIETYYGNEPRFENDEDFLPLQAADLWAWWVRKWYAEGTPEKIEHAEFGYWNARRDKHPKIDIQIDEDGLVKAMKIIIAAGIEPGRPIYDIKYNINL